MAEDFHDAFEVSSDETTISNIDANGVALAAIQGLSEKLVERDERIADLEEDNAELRERIAALEDHVFVSQTGPESGTSLSED